MDREVLQQKLALQREQEALAWRQLHIIQGSIAMLEDLLAPEPDALTIPELGRYLNAVEIGEPEPYEAPA